MASHLNQTLRTALLVSEFGSRVGEPLRVTIGRPLPAEEIRGRAGDGRALIDFLRCATHELAPGPKDCSPGLYLG